MQEVASFIQTALLNQKCYTTTKDKKLQIKKKEKT